MLKKRSGSARDKLVTYFEEEFQVSQGDINALAGISRQLDETSAQKVLDELSFEAAKEIQRKQARPEQRG